MKILLLAILAIALNLNTRAGSEEEPPKGIYFSGAIHLGPMTARPSNLPANERLFLVGSPIPQDGLGEMGDFNPKIGITEKASDPGNMSTINWGELEFNVGHKTFPGRQRRVGIRTQGGIKWIRAALGGLTYQENETAEVLAFPVEEFLDLLQIEMGGTARMFGPHGGVFLDFHFDDAGHFIYAGSSFGLVNLNVEYNIRTQLLPFDLSTQDSNWVSVFKHEMGVGFQLNKRLALKVGYEFSKFGTTELFSGPDKGLVTPTGRHNFKLSLLHWFRRK